MNLLVAEIVLALVALRRGWRLAPALLVAASAAAFLYSPPGLASGVAHALALVGLVAACSSDPSERLEPRPRRRQGAGPLYQI